MKKSVKILTLVLSLALICGALVVAAFAEDDATAIKGIVLDNAADFEGTNYGPGGQEIPTAESAGANDKTTAIDNDGAAKAVQFKHQKGGQPKILTNPYDNNSYITVDWTVNANTSNGHFFDTYHKGNSWKNWKDEADAPYYGTKLTYTIMDVDLMWEDPANYDGTGFFYPYLGYTNAAGSGHKAIDQATGIRFVNNGDSVAVKIQDSQGKFNIGSNGNWSHVTFILGYELVGEEGAQTVKINEYLAVDGVIVDTYSFTPDVKAADVYKSDLTRLFSKDIRFNVFGAKTTSACADNYVIRSITPEYNGNLAAVLAKGVGTNLNEWESNIYDANKMPFGKLVATIGETPYDSLAKALAAADGSAPIVLKTNITTPVVVDKMVTIECGEYTTAGIQAGKGFTLTYNEETKTYTVEAAQGEFYITWDACTCGLDICDETHPGGIDTVGWEGGNLGASYEKDKNWSITIGHIRYVLAGWTDEEGNLVDLDSKITTEMCEDIVAMTLTPVIEEQTTQFSYAKADGTIAYTDDLNAAINNVPAGGTITLLKNAAHKFTATKGLGKSLTIDLNGFVLDLTADSKFNTFQVNTHTLTFLGAKEGSAVLAGYWNNDGKVNRKCAGTFLTSGNGAVMNFIGPNLTVSCAALYGNWGSPAVTINLDGVCFNNVSGASDNPATIYHKGKATVSIKDSVIRNAGNFIGLTVAGVGSTLTLDNSTYIGTGDLVNASYKNIAITIKNSNVASKITATDGITVEGDCKFTTNEWASNAKFAEGVKLTEAYGNFNHVINSNKWVPAKESGVCGFKADEINKFTQETVNKDYNYTTGKAVKLTFTKDGETIKTLDAIPGGKIKAYADSTPVADGWVNKSTNYWYTATDADATIDIKDITDTGSVFEVGAPKLYFNHFLSDNLTANLYVPATLPEGLEITNINLNGAHDGRKLEGNYTIGGVAYKTTQAWPQGNYADEGVNWTITFTYGEKTYNYKVVMNVVSYAQKVASIYANDAEKMQQVTALMQYVEACNKIANSTISNGLSEYLAELKTTVTLPTIPEAVGNMAGLREYITGAQMITVSGKGGALAFTLSDKAIADGVTIKLTTYPQAGERVIVSQISDGKVYTFGDSLVAWGKSDITITVLNADGDALATGVYSLAAYNTEAEAMGATADQLALIEAIYALAYIGNTNN